MKEPQIGIEPMTARREKTARAACSLSDKSTTARESAQDRPEARPNLRKSGNEVAIGARRRLPDTIAIYMVERAVCAVLEHALLGSPDSPIAPVRGWE